MKTYIYTLRREDSTEIRYVGKTSNLNRRYTQHMSPSSYRNEKSTWLKNWVFKSKKDGVKILIEELEFVDSDGCIEEKYWIAQFTAWGFKLVNLTEGGDGAVGYKHSKKAKKKMSKFRTGKKHSPETIKKLIESHTGKKLSDEAKKKISKIHKGSKLSEEIKLKRYRVPIICVEDNKRFEYVSEAAKYYNVCLSSISNNLKGDSKKLRNGKSFKYAEI
jgi:group I intron endonuclease